MLPPPRADRPRTPPRQARRHHRGFSTMTSARAGTPSMGSTSTSQSKRAWVLLACSTCMALPSTLVVCRNLDVPRQEPTSRGILSRAPRACLAARSRERERCFSPTSATDLRHEHPRKGPSIPRLCTRAALRPRLRRRPPRRANDPGSASLDGEASSFGFHHHLPDDLRKPKLPCDRRGSAARSWRVLRFDSPSGSALVEGVVFPRSSR